MKWFGESWGAPLCGECEHVSTPVGELCVYCEEPIEANQAGVVMPAGDAHGHFAEKPEHYECFIRQIVGSVAHITMQCSCYVPGSLASDPPGVTKRQAAIDAERMFRVVQYSSAMRRPLQ